jgi:YHS domain-containing protein
MADLNKFLKRLDEQVEKARKGIELKQTELQEAYQGRTKRYRTFLQLMAELHNIARPRLEKLAERCKFDATPKEDADSKSVLLKFKTPVARVQLRLAATHDTEVRNLVLVYDLEILPLYVKFNPHAELEIPLEQVTWGSVENWLDDRLVEFAQTYVTIHFMDQYHQDHMVVDPVADVRFPKAYAHASLEKEGETYYFIAEETQREFEERHLIMKQVSQPA